MKYILYFDGYDNDTYFYKTIEEMLEHWNCRTIEELINKYKNNRWGMGIYKIEEVIYDSEENKI